MRHVLLLITGGVLGIIAGFFIFTDTRQRDFLPLPGCTECWSSKELGGLLVSLGMIKTPGLVPGVVRETDKVIAMKSPEPLADIDYLILPKRDILDLGDLTLDDSAYIAESFEIIADLIRTENLRDYKVITNGPGFQQVRYLHFHLLAE